ncbi:MAG: ECF transporter S component [Acutalibacteraceae bacterium]|jgi:ECF transporter S component (folate family)
MGKNSNKNLSKNVQSLCLSAVMAALYVGLDYLAINGSKLFGGSLKISFNAIPIFIVAVFCGPLWGTATGFVGSFIAQLLTYGFDQTTMLWVIPSAIRGLAVGLLFIAFKRSLKPSRLIAISCISSVIVTACNTVSLIIADRLKGVYTIATVLAGVPARVITGIATAIIIALMLPTILDSVKKIIKFDPVKISN